MSTNPYEAPQSIPPPTPGRRLTRLAAISLYISAVLLVFTLIGWVILLKQSGSEALLMASPYLVLILANRLWKRSRTIQTGILVAAVPVLSFGALLVVGMFTYNREPGPDLMGMAMGSLLQITVIGIVTAATALVLWLRRG